MRLRGHDESTVFDKSMKKLDLDIVGIFITNAEKKYAFTLLDKANDEDYRTAYYLPGSLYKFEITTIKGRSGELEKNQVPTVEVLYQMQRTRSLKLDASISRSKPFLKPGVDVFIKAGETLPKIDGLVITNTAENYGTKWKIEKVACYICNKVEKRQLKWESGVYWIDIVLKDNILYTSCDESSPEGTLVRGIKRTETLRLHESNVKEKSFNEPHVGEIDQVETNFADERSTSQASNIGFTTVIRSPTSRPSTQLSSNFESETLADVSSSSIETVMENTTVPEQPELVKKLITRSRENLEIQRLEEAKRLENERKEREARERLDEIKRNQEIEANKKAELKKRQEELLAKVERERQERMLAQQSQDEGRLQKSDSVSSIISTIGFNDDGTYTGRMAMDRTRPKDDPVQVTSQPKKTVKKVGAKLGAKSNKNLDSCASEISTIGLNTDGSYLGRKLGTKTKPESLAEAYTEVTNQPKNVVKISDSKVQGLESQPNRNVMIKTTSNFKIDLNDTPTMTKEIATGPANGEPFRVTKNVSKSDNFTERGRIYVTKPTTTVSNFAINQTHELPPPLEKKTENKVVRVEEVKNLEPSKTLEEIDQPKSEPKKDSLPSNAISLPLDSDESETEGAVEILESYILIDQGTSPMPEIDFTDSNFTLSTVTPEPVLNKELSTSTTSLQLRKEHQEVVELRRQYKQSQIQLAKAEQNLYRRKIAELTIKENEINSSLHRKPRKLSVSLISSEELSEEITEDDEDWDESEDEPPVPAVRTTIIQNTFVETAEPEPKVEVVVESDHGSIEKAELADEPTDLPEDPLPVKRVPFARAKPKRMRNHRHNTLENPILEPYFNRKRSGLITDQKISRNISRASSVTHSILNMEEVVYESSDKGVQAYFPDENVPIQHAIMKTISKEYVNVEGIPSKRISTTSNK